MSILGIDPGITGGLALLGDESVILDTMPVTIEGELDPAAITRWILAHRADIGFAVVEKPFAMPGQGFYAAFKFGWNSAIVVGILAGLRIRYQLVSAATWSKEFPVQIPETKDKQERRRLIKNARKDLVRKWFPAVDFRESDRSRTFHDGMVDALLIAAYGRRKLKAEHGEDQED